MVKKKQSRMKLLNQYTSRTVPGGVGGLLAITDASQVRTSARMMGMGM
jgi:hypothetical protein